MNQQEYHRDGFFHFTTTQVSNHTSSLLFMNPSNIFQVQLGKHRNFIKTDCHSHYQRHVVL